MKRGFWPADVTHVTIPTDIDRVEIGLRREDTDGNPKEPQIVVYGSDPMSAVVYKGEEKAPNGATKLLTDDTRGSTYYYTKGGE